MREMHQAGYPYSFNPDACLQCEGKCCTGDSGYIWVTPQEIETIARALGLNRIDFMQKYLNQVENRWSIKELRSGEKNACVFFSIRKRECAIYPVRPAQCRSFPFWEYYRTRLEELLDECPGVRPDKG